MLVFLFFVGFLGGVLNAVGGGATFLVFPALVLAGVSPLQANVTASVALWPASIVTAIAYRKNLVAPRRVVAVLGTASAIGAAVGAMLLLRTPVAAFTRVVPYLLLLASLVFTFVDPIAKWLARKAEPGDDGARSRARSLAIVVALQIVVGVYGGYFGAGMGILMLAELSLLRMGDVHALNAVRSILTIVINAVCVAIFVSASAVAWRPGLVMMAGAMTGGYVGAAVVRKIHPRYMRGIILAVAWTMTVYFFARGR